jgi:hypothetical protein
MSGAARTCAIQASLTHLAGAPRSVLAGPVLSQGARRRSALLAGVARPRRRYRRGPGDLAEFGVPCGEGEVDGGLDVVELVLHPAELRVDVGVQPPELRADVVCDGGPQVTSA